LRSNEAAIDRDCYSVLIILMLQVLATRGVNSGHCVLLCGAASGLLLEAIHEAALPRVGLRTLDGRILGGCVVTKWFLIREVLLG